MGTGRGTLVAIFIGFAATAPGCAFGPKAIEKTHGRYAESVRRVEEEQLLRQIVLMRYGETAVGLDVSAIAAQYELTASAEARPFFIDPTPATATSSSARSRRFCRSRRSAARAARRSR